MEDINANFVFPLRDVENERVKLTPFIPAIHAETMFEYAEANPEIYNFMPHGSTRENLESFLSITFAQDPGWALYAIHDKTTTGDPAFAGIVGWIYANAAHLKAEIGSIVIFPAFQRTHVATNAVGLMLQYGLDLPRDGGLGLRRVQWQAHAENAPSIRLAERMGFVREGTLRWDRVLPDAKVGVQTREGDPKEKNVGRHSAMLAICWDDWERERERILAQMERVK